MKLLKIEWIKASSSITFWLMLGLYIIIVPLLLHFFNNFYVSINEIEVDVSELAQITAVSFWPFLYYLTSYLIWIPIFLVVMNLSSDRNNRLWKQHVIDGLSRNELFTGKMIYIGFVSLFVTLAVTIFGTGFIFLTDIEYSASMWNVMLLNSIAFFACHFLYMVMGLTLNLIIKNTALTLILFLAWAWIVERVIRFFDKSNVTDFLPINSFNDVIVNPFIELLMLNESQLTQETAIISSIFWLIIFGGYSWYYFTKSDL